MCKKAFTLIEVLLVIVVMAFLLVLAVPGYSRTIASVREANTINLVTSALRSAQAHAAKYQKYTGVRLQKDGDRQYIILIEHRPIKDHLERFAAVPNIRRHLIPVGMGVLPSNVDDISLMDGDAIDCLADSQTFTILFTPSGQLVSKQVSISASDNVEQSVKGFYIYKQELLNQPSQNKRFTNYISTLDVRLINMYTGNIIQL